MRCYLSAGNGNSDDLSARGDEIQVAMAVWDGKPPFGTETSCGLTHRCEGSMITDMDMESRSDARRVGISSSLFEVGQEGQL